MHHVEVIQSECSDVFGYLIWISNIAQFDTPATVHTNERLRLYKLRLQKIGSLHMPKQDTGQLSGNHAADQHLCFHYMNSTMPLLPKSEISSL